MTTFINCRDHEDTTIVWLDHDAQGSYAIVQSREPFSNERRPGGPRNKAAMNKPRVNLEDRRADHWIEKQMPVYTECPRCNRGHEIPVEWLRDQEQGDQGTVLWS